MQFYVPAACNVNLGNHRVSTGINTWKGLQESVISAGTQFYPSPKPQNIHFKGRKLVTLGAAQKWMLFGKFSGTHFRRNPVVKKSSKMLPVT